MFKSLSLFFLLHFSLPQVADVIKMLDVDIFNMVEVESCNILKNLSSIMNSDDTDYNAYLKRGDDFKTGNNVGLLTKIDPVEDLGFKDTHIKIPIEGSNCNSELVKYTGRKSSELLGDETNLTFQTPKKRKFGWCLMCVRDNGLLRHRAL